MLVARVRPHRLLLHPAPPVTIPSLITLSVPGTEPSQPLEGPDEPNVVGLVDRVVATRDQDAFGELYDRFIERVYRYLYFRTGSHPEAEDLAEQVFLKAWEAIGRYRWQGRPFLAWLYRLAHNAHIDYVRGQKPTTSLNNDAHPIEIASPRAAVELARALDADLLAGALCELTFEQQQVIVMKFIDGLDNEQIAQAMDKRQGAIRALQMRALMSLRRVLESQGERGPE
jgi:RNA polymerase sigma-70 factor, ECF subfamily